MNLWVVGIIYLLLAIGLIEALARAPELPWHD